MPDAGRNLRHAMECGHRRPALFQELSGYTTYKMGFVTREGLLMAIMLTILPFIFFGSWSALPPLAGEDFVCQKQPRHRSSASIRSRPQWVEVMDDLREALAQICTRLESLEHRFLLSSICRNQRSRSRSTPSFRKLKALPQSTSCPSQQEFFQSSAGPCLASPARTSCGQWRNRVRFPNSRS